MKAFLIDPATKTISALEYSGGDRPSAIYGHIGASGFDIARLTHWSRGVRAVAFVDDEGLRKPNACFTLAGAQLAGKALVLGEKRTGATTDCPLTLEALLECVRWVSQDDAVAAVRRDQDELAARYRALGYHVQQDGFLNVIVAPEKKE